VTCVIGVRLFPPAGLVAEVAEGVDVAVGLPNMFPPPKRLLEDAEVLVVDGVVESVGLAPRSPPPATGVDPTQR
jgi:hypothetical protein